MMPSYKQVLLLRRLIDSGGHVSWADLSQGECRDGTLLSRRDLCRWVPCSRVDGTKRLEITQAGRDVVTSEDALDRVTRRGKQ
jgi:hypothetical protein